VVLLELVQPVQVTEKLGVKIMGKKFIGSLAKGVIKKAKKRRPAAAAAGGGKKPPGNGGALFKQEGASVKGKSRLAEDSDVLAGSGPRRKQAERLEKQSMVSDPNYAKMEEVGSRGEKVTEGGQRTLNAIAKRRKINEKSVRDAKKAQEKIKKEIQSLKNQVKTISADKSKTPAKRVADGLKVKNRIKDKESLLQQAKDKEANASGKTPKKSPRISRTEMKAGGKIDSSYTVGTKSFADKVKKANDAKKKKVNKKAGGGRMSRVGLSPAEESRSGVMSEADRKSKIMFGYKKGGQV